MASPRNPLDLTGKTALVTGSGRGIGYACARMLAEHGADIVLNDKIDSTALPDQAAELAKTFGRRAWAFHADAAEPAAVTGLYQKIMQAAGRLDIVIANAGVMQDALIGMVTPQQIEHTLAVNVAGVINHIQMAARLMRRNPATQPAGSIVALSSIVGRFGNKGQLLYGASKAAVIGAVQSAAKELAPQNIRVNAIAPGFIDTQLTANLPPESRQQWIDGIGMGRIGQPEDIARVALFLASDLSAYVTGQIVGVDGGMVL
jgi:3-oxoacyl-[acyl-carrier protein] reductase